MALELAYDLMEFWEIHGHAGEARQWVREALALNPQPRGRGLGLLVIGRFAGWQGDLDEALDALEQAAETFAALDDPARFAHTLSNAAFTHMLRGELEKSLTLNERAVQEARRSGDEWMIAWTLNSQGCALGASGEYVRANAAMFRRLGDRRFETAPVGNLGEQALARGELDAAERHTKRALTLVRELGDKTFLASVLINLAHIALARGRLGESEAYAREASEAARELADKIVLVEAIITFAALAAAQGDEERAVELWATAEARLQASSYEISPALSPTFETRSEPLRSRLHEDALGRAWERGRTRELHEAIEATVVDPDRAAISGRPPQAT